MRGAELDDVTTVVSAWLGRVASNLARQCDGC